MQLFKTGRCLYTVPGRVEHSASSWFWICLSFYLYWIWAMYVVYIVLLFLIIIIHMTLAFDIFLEIYEEKELFFSVYPINHNTFVFIVHWALSVLYKCQTSKFNLEPLFSYFMNCWRYFTYKICIEITMMPVTLRLTLGSVEYSRKS